MCLSGGGRTLTTAAEGIDNRAACAVALALMENLMDDDFPGTLWVAGTVQEERGLAGARTAAQFVRPDWFIALDVALAGDTPENPEPGNRCAWVRAPW